MSDVDPIVRRKTYELVADRLLTDIGGRRLKPGDALPTERELTQAYRVGRSSVREALRMLESQGLIRETDSGGFAVSEPRPLHQSLHVLVAVDGANVHELYEMRKLLEGGFAALAAARRSDADLAEMRAAHEEMVASLDSEQQYIEADLRFHIAVAAATGNRVALHLMAAIRELLQRVLVSIYHVPGSPQRSLDQHRLIVEAIAARRPEAARRRMNEHLERVERDFEGSA